MKWTLIALFLMVATCLAGPEIQQGNNGWVFSSQNPGMSWGLQFKRNLSDTNWTDWGSVSESSITGETMALDTPLYFQIVELEPGVVTDIPLRVFLCTRGYDRDGNTRISSNEIARVHYIDFTGGAWGWPSLDFSSFTNIGKIRLNMMPDMTNLNVNGCLSLTNLICSDVGDANLVLTNCPALIRVDYETETIGGLTNLVLAGLPNLESFKADNNSLTVLDISRVTSSTAGFQVTGNPLAMIIVSDTNNLPGLSYDGTPEIREP